MQWSAITWRSANPARQEPEHRWYHKGRTSGVQQDVASGAAGGFIRRQPVTGFSRYSVAGSAIPATECFNPISWWSRPDVVEAFPTLQRWAFDILACPATSCECERASSSAKLLIPPERNSLDDDLIEALECLRAWWNNGLVKRH